MTNAMRRTPPFFFWIFALLAACDDTDDQQQKEDTGTDLVYADLDEDGYDTRTDCNDGDPNINPGATEVCDGADNDCDGLLDEEDAIDASTWYFDGDGDGYGDDDLVRTACMGASDYVSQGGDCDDGDAQVNPDQTEVCDGVDNDCDGLADDEDPDLDTSGASLFYPDDDSDGFGDEDSSGELLCEANADYPVTDNSDCDDRDDSAYPGAEETWYDGTDQDCDGASDYDFEGEGYDSQDYGGEDCDDEDPSFSPDAYDDTVDGVDQNCDGIDGPIGIEDLASGDLVVCEVMQNPDEVDDSSGEWFEIYNGSGYPVDLDGLLVYDGGTDSFEVTGTAVVNTGGYLVFGNNDDTLSNGGVDVDYPFDPSVMALGNGGDEIHLANAKGTIDSLAWDGGILFPDPTGASMTLDVDSHDALSNDLGGNWCEAYASYGDGDLGTPGAESDGCSGWIGTRELLLDIYGYGTVCDMWWDSLGTASSNICTDCDWAYDLLFSYIGDDLGGCDGSSYLPSYTVGLHPSYYFAGYGSYDMLMLYYGTTWYTQFFVDQYGGGSIDYYTWWYRYSSYGYYYIYYWYGEAYY